MSAAAEVLIEASTGCVLSAGTDQTRIRPASPVMTAIITTGAVTWRTVTVSARAAVPGSALRASGR